CAVDKNHYRSWISLCHRFDKFVLALFEAKIWLVRSFCVVFVIDSRHHDRNVRRAGCLDGFFDPGQIAARQETPSKQHFRSAWTLIEAHRYRVAVAGAKANGTTTSLGAVISPIVHHFLAVDLDVGAIVALGRDQVFATLLRNETSTPADREMFSRNVGSGRHLVPIEID